MGNPAMEVFGGSREARATRAKEEPSVSTGRPECRGVEARLESEECRVQKESRASPVQTPARGYPACPDPRVF